MPPRLGVPLLVLMLGALLAGCASKVCTAIGCADQATLSFGRADGAWPGLYVALDVDDRHVECAVPTVAPGSSISCASDIAVQVREEQECHEERTASAVSLRCVGTGRFKQEIVIQGAPRALHLVLLNRDVQSDEKTFTPVYQAAQPNGPGCEPTCRQWSTAWLLPDDA